MENNGQCYSDVVVQGNGGGGGGGAEGGGGSCHYTVVFACEILKFLLYRDILLETVVMLEWCVYLLTSMYLYPETVVSHAHILEARSLLASISCVSNCVVVQLVLLQHSFSGCDPLAA